MITRCYSPTEQQQHVVDHSGPAFISACPGAGKTRTLVERARRILAKREDRRGVAFLSFTNAAVDELEARLQAFAVLPSPLFPSFIGTFDRFLWQFFVVPFGIEGCNQSPRLVPDKDDWEVKPFDTAQPLPLRYFDRTTGIINADLAAREGFDVRERSVAAYQTIASRIIEDARRQGRVDFEDVRLSVQKRLGDASFAGPVGAALAARFSEIIVDEAQDCNPVDLCIIDWLRNAGISVKVICDPNQSIYGFRGGVTNELRRFAETFSVNDRLPLSGNFRSSPAICCAVVALRSPSERGNRDEALGPYRYDTTPVHVLSYAGAGVPPAIGLKFQELVGSLSIPIRNAPVLAATRASAAKALGQTLLERTNHATLVLADATINYQLAFSRGGRRDALVNLHRVVLWVQGRIASLGEYHRHLMAEGLEDGRWRPSIIQLADLLRFDPEDTADQWLQRARELLRPGLAGLLNINQRLRNHADLAKILVAPSVDSPPARTIHSAKGMEFPAVCVVMTTKTAGGILDFLEGQAETSADEDARKIYVGASRAERLLALAVPRSRVTRLCSLLRGTGCLTEVHEL